MSTGFNELGISAPILRAIEDMGFETPTEVQERAIPHALNREDLIVRSKTGSGKTAVFGVSMLQMTDPDAPGPQGLVLTPTRELAVQIDSDLKMLSKHLKHKTTAVYGQHSMNVEIEELRKNISIVTGTPGRVFDHIEHRNLKTGNIRFLVLDEADRMLDMGFIDQVKRIVETLPKNRVTLLFSATIPDEVHNICKRYMKNPETIEIESATKTVDTIRQVYYRMDRSEKRTQLNRLLLLERPKSCMIFCNTRIAVDQVQRFLSGKGYASGALHGDIPQGKRLKTMQQFKQGAFNLLVATDVAARGIHIDDLSLVVNYDVPLERDSYVHRIGRTGRAGNEGRAITLVTGDDIMSLYEIEEHIGAMIEEGQLPGDAEFNRCRTEAEEWMTLNKAKGSPDSEDSERVSNRTAGSHGHAGRRQPRERRGEQPPKGAPQNRTPSGQRNARPESQAKQGGKMTVSAKSAQSAAKPLQKASVPAKSAAQADTKPLQKAPVQAKSAVAHASASPRPAQQPKQKNYIDVIKANQTSKTPETKHSVSGKPLLQRIFQRLLGKKG